MIPYSAAHCKQSLGFFQKNFPLFPLPLHNRGHSAHTTAKRTGKRLLAWEKEQSVPKDQGPAGTCETLSPCRALAVCPLLPDELWGRGLIF